MSENMKDQHQDLRKNKHGIATAAGVALCIVYGLAARNDLLFGLVLATVYLFSMNVAVRMCKKFAGRGRGKLTPVRFIGALAVGVVAALIVAVVLAIVDPLSIEGDNIIITIIRHFFDSETTIAFAAGWVAGYILHSMETE